MNEQKTKGGTVAYIDDEQTFHLYYGDMMRESGLPLETFSNPKEALEAISKNPEKYGFIITDYSMPDYGMTGTSFLIELQNKINLAGINLAIFSSYIGMEGYVERFKGELSGFRYLEKVKFIGKWQNEAKEPLLEFLTELEAN